MSKIRFIGLDVHADPIAVAVAEPDGEVRSLGVIPNPPGTDPQTDHEIGPGEEPQCLLRSLPVMFCTGS